MFTIHVPNDFNEAFKGFSRKTTTLTTIVVSEELKTITYSKVQLCAEYRAITDECPRVKCYDVPNSSVETTFTVNINSVGLFLQTYVEGHRLSCWW